MKRHLLKLGVFLLLGAIVNVAVAWVIEVSWHNLDSGRLEMPQDEARELWARHLGNSMFVRAERYTGWAERLDIVSLWDNYMIVSSSAVGWPCLALSGESSIDTVGRRTLHSIWSIGKPPDTHWLPLSPLWPGFAINTIFYAAMLWLLWNARRTPGKIRRFVRASRGRCPACGFIIAPGTAAASGGPCSECGAASPRQQHKT